VYLARASKGMSPSSRHSRMNSSAPHWNLLNHTTQRLISRESNEHASEDPLLDDDDDDDDEAKISHRDPLLRDKSAVLVHCLMSTTRALGWLSMAAQVAHRKGCRFLLNFC
jgi:hypothetical protein